MQMLYFPEQSAIIIHHISILIPAFRYPTGTAREPGRRMAKMNN